jgi:O6-methylguanine-DNA--protein-cysteine methyltransferase
METDRKWIIVRIDGKIAAISTDYSLLASISAVLARNSQGKSSRNKDKRKGIMEKGPVYREIIATTASLEDVWQLKQETGWEDLMLFGTEFQKKVWRKLWELSHRDGNLSTGSSADMPNDDTANLICYSDFAELCQNRAGVRAVAHAIGLNPVSVIIPCHLVIPKESIDKIRNIHKKAEATIFKGDDLCINSILSDSSIDFGEYALGRKLKRELILRELA